MTDDRIERGAAEEESGTPVTPTEVEAARTPPSRGPGDGPDRRDDDEIAEAHGEPPVG